MANTKTDDLKVIKIEIEEEPDADINFGYDSYILNEEDDKVDSTHTSWEPKEDPQNFVSNMRTLANCKTDMIKSKESKLPPSSLLEEDSADTKITEKRFLSPGGDCTASLPEEDSDSEDGWTEVDDDNRVELQLSEEDVETYSVVVKEEPLDYEDDEYSVEQGGYSSTQSIGYGSKREGEHSTDDITSSKEIRQPLTQDQTFDTHKEFPEKPHQCTVCGKRFSQIVYLRRHLRTHTGHKRYQCSICSKRFFRNNDLSRHMRAHTGEKPYVCSVCGKGFTVNCHLTTHMRSHTGEKPYQCTICNKGFSHGSARKSHMLTHTGERPYLCNVCNKRFSRAGNLRSHLRTHTGEKPHQCNVCYKSFSRNNDAVRHMRIHTKERSFSGNPSDHVGINTG